MVELTKTEAKQWIIENQLLRQFSLSGKEGLIQLFRQLSYVQIDTIQIVERAHHHHHHTIWTRIPGYNKQWLDELQIQGLKEVYYCLSADLSNFPRRSLNRLGNSHKFDPTTSLFILSPFDNAIILRNRTKNIFDFDYKLECYVPEKKRVYGYWCLSLCSFNVSPNFVGVIRFLIRANPYRVVSLCNIRKN